MKNAIEVRMPFMDFNLVRYAFNLSHEYKIDQNTKICLRKIYKNKLPDKIIERKDKKGFTDPLEYIFSIFKDEILKILKSKINENFSSWNTTNLYKYVKYNYKYDNLDNLKKIWPYINYYILIDEVDLTYKKQIKKFYFMNYKIIRFSTSPYLIPNISDILKKIKDLSFENTKEFFFKFIF